MSKMKGTNRVVISVSVILILLIVLLTRHLLDLGNQYSAFTYFRASLVNSFSHAPSNYLPAAGVETGDKVVVMAKMESEDTNWVTRELPSFVNTAPIFPPLQALFSNIHLIHYSAGNVQFIPSTHPRLPPQTTHLSPL